MKFALILVPEKVKLPEKKQDKNPVNWKEDAKPETKWSEESKVEDVIKEGYPINGVPKEKMEIDLQLLSKNSIYLLKTWKKVTEEEKDKDGYPRGLRKILDEAGEGILNFS